MTKKRLTDPMKVPPNMSEKEEAEFWDKHEITKDYLDRAKQAADEELPPRSKNISVRFDEDTLRRLKRLASKRRKRYQTLLKEFVIERLREEEQLEYPADRRKVFLSHALNDAVFSFSGATAAPWVGHNVVPGRSVGTNYYVGQLSAACQEAVRVPGVDQAPVPSTTMARANVLNDTVRVFSQGQNQLVVNEAS